MRNPTIVAGLFDFLKESEESKAAKEAEWQAIQEKARLRRDPEAFAKYEAEVKARRMREDSARRAEEAVLQGKNDIVVDYAAKSPTQKASSRISCALRNVEDFSFSLPYEQACLLVLLQADVLPDGWSSAVDEASGNTYYFNKEKGITQWNRPYK
ncbi:MAG: hypothetical protein SGPRY_001084 [Prymnesium sp.]